MKIVCLLGSPRPEGNSAIIARRFCEAAEGLGCEVRTFALNKLKYRGCQACMTCKTRLDRCVLKDDLSDVLEAVRESDVVVMASPTYYGDLSSQLKAFVDRTFSFLVPDYQTNANPSRLSPGKKLVFIQTQARPDQNAFSDVFPRYEGFFKWYGFDGAYLIRACGVVQAGEVETHKEVLSLAEETARKILNP
ncbi:NADPH-dependent FMN reductase [uncultured Desulfobacterium sp.]|uniref:NADPH-dependent FMN reductase n=1 Tax=uncultured Desulfobacterium sp. TaxID=201089 RepID=A0A445MYS3_9BACT|nr:NADPH-dependent FMN reductase [uncultured Desulfobacterium sp.]